MAASENDLLEEGRIWAGIFPGTRNSTKTPVTDRVYRKSGAQLCQKTMVTDTFYSMSGSLDTPQAGSQILVEEFEGDQQVLPRQRETPRGITMGVDGSGGVRVGERLAGKVGNDVRPPPPSATCLYRSRSGSVTDTLTDTF